MITLITGLCKFNRAIKKGAFIRPLTKIKIPKIQKKIVAIIPLTKGYSHQQVLQVRLRLPPDFLGCLHSSCPQLHKPRSGKTEIYIRTGIRKITIWLYQVNSQEDKDTQRSGYDSRPSWSGRRVIIIASLWSKDAIHEQPKPDSRRT